MRNYLEMSRPVLLGAAAIASTGLTAGLVLGVGGSANATRADNAEFTPPDGFVLTQRVSMEAAEKATADCMADAGWGYLPFLHDVEVYSTFGTDGSPREASAESPQLAHFIGSAEDPNDAMVGALSPSERADFNRALYGAQVDLDAQGQLTGQELTSTQGACR
jgi:hypothetical protein